MNKTLTTILIAIAALLGCVVLFKQNTNNVSLGSVSTGDEYRATTTVSMASVFNTIRVGATSLGSVIVSSSSATVLRLWDATSTTDTASTTIATFVAAAENGTYQFDVILPRGLVVEKVAGFNGSYTITSK